MKYLLLRLNVQCREGFKNKSKVTYSRAHTHTHLTECTSVGREEKEVKEGKVFHTQA